MPCFRDDFQLGTWYLFGNSFSSFNGGWGIMLTDYDKSRSFDFRYSALKI
jgi:hypothetical protein